MLTITGSKPKYKNNLQKFTAFNQTAKANLYELRAMKKMNEFEQLAIRKFGETVTAYDLEGLIIDVRDYLDELGIKPHEWYEIRIEQAEKATRKRKREEKVTVQKVLDENYRYTGILYERVKKMIDNDPNFSKQVNDKRFNTRKIVQEMLVAHVNDLLQRCDYDMKCTIFHVKTWINNNDPIGVHIFLNDLTKVIEEKRRINKC